MGRKAKQILKPAQLVLSLVQLHCFMIFIYLYILSCLIKDSQTVQSVSDCISVSEENQWQPMATTTLAARSFDLTGLVAGPLNQPFQDSLQRTILLLPSAPVSQNEF